MKVIKKDGSKVLWDFSKIVTAITKSATRMNCVITQEELDTFKHAVEEEIKHYEEVDVPTVHKIVESKLELISSVVQKSYQDYRNYKTDFVYLWDDVYRKSNEVLYHGDKENANYESSLISTKGSLIRGYLTKELYKKFEMTLAEQKESEDGYVYIHDMRDLIFGGINCCLFDIKTVLTGGFSMNGIKYKEPKSILSALQVIGDITLVSTAQQFGGWSISEIDKVLVPYFEKSINSYKLEANEWGISDVDSYAMKKTLKDLNQGMQSIEMKLNTVPCSRGDVSFVTFSFGNVDGSVNKEYQRLICKEILTVRMNGQGGNSPVVFPKLVYLHEENQHTESDQQNLFDIAITCSSKAMYPDYLSLNSGKVGEIYQKTGKVVTGMGCRAYLSEYYDPETNECFFEGRANIGAVSLNLPMIWKKSNGKEFFNDLEYYLLLIREFLKKRYDKIANTKCSTNPLAFTQGGLYKGFKNPNDYIGYDIVKSFTASFGITALNELNVLNEGKQLHESNRRWINEVVDFISKKVELYKKEDGYLYALYGTPGENLLGVQTKQYREMFGVEQDVSSREYFSNSFHCHVTADISPFEKQDLEEELFHKINGGHIQYVRIEDRRNALAIKSIVKRGMQKGFYQGVNFDLVTCEDCGHQPLSIVDICPMCKSNHITIIERNCGYLSYFKLNGDTRLNDAKYAEIQERKSM